MRLLETVFGNHGAKEAHHATGVEVIEKEYHLMGLILELLTEHGGVQGLQDWFSGKGFGNKFASWVGFEENQPITPDQIQQVIGNERLDELCHRFELDPAQVPGLLAYYLPKIIDWLTPGGEIEQHQDLAGFLVALLHGGLDQMLSQDSPRSFS